MSQLSFLTVDVDVIPVKKSVAKSVRVVGGKKSLQPQLKFVNAYRGPDDFLIDCNESKPRPCVNRFSFGEIDHNDLHFRFYKDILGHLSDDRGSNWKQQAIFQHFVFDQIELDRYKIRPFTFSACASLMIDSLGETVDPYELQAHFNDGVNEYSYPWDHEYSVRAHEECYELWVSSIRAKHKPTIGYLFDWVSDDGFLITDRTKPFSLRACCKYLGYKFGEKQKELLRSLL